MHCRHATWRMWPFEWGAKQGFFGGFTKMDGVGPFLRHLHLSGDVGSTGRRWKSCMWFGHFHGENRRTLFFFTWMDCRVPANSIQVGTETSHGLESRGAPDVSTSMWGQLERCTCPFCRLANYSERHLKYMSQTHLDQQLGNIF